MNYEDFMAFAFPALIISCGFLISIIPAYLASQRNKSFWRWWLFSASIFSIFSLILVKAQAFSLMIYLLAIMPVISITAVLPTPEYLQTDFSISSFFRDRGTAGRSKDIVLFLFGFICMLAIGSVLYFSVRSDGTQDWQYAEKWYFITLTAMFLIACLGLASFIFVISNKRILHILASALLTFLLALPVFLEPSRAYVLLRIQGAVIRTDILLGVVVTDLINKPVAGIFVLIGICSGCMTVLTLLNDRYKFVPALGARGVAGTFLILNVIASQLPLIRLTRSRYLSSYILAAVILLRLLLLRLFMNVNESLGLLLLIPSYLAALVIGIMGAILSSILVALSVSQQKILAAAGIVVIGLIAVSKDPALEWTGFHPFRAVVYYGFASGFTALVLWVASDYLVRDMDQR